MDDIAHLEHSLWSLKNWVLIIVFGFLHCLHRFIEFEYESAAKTAVASLNNFELGGLTLHVAPAIVGGALNEGMKALDKVPPQQPPPAGITPPVVVKPQVIPVKPTATVNGTYKRRSDFYHV